MKTNPLIRVSDPEMDMDRTGGRRAQTSRVFAAVQKWFARREIALGSIDTPQRSVARELEPFSSFWG